MLKGTKHTRETRKKMREAQLGKKLSEEHKRKIGLKNKGRNPWNTNKKLSDAHRKKISRAMKGNQSALGAVRTDAFKEKIRKSRIGKSSGMLGKTHKLEYKKKLSEKWKKSNNPNWNYGSSFEPYSVDWTKTLRISIKERDKYICQLCGEKQEGISYDIHHKDYNKKNNNPDNLVTLCKSCHMKTNYNRNYWINYFRGV